VKAPTSEEIDQIIRKQKRNRSPGEYNIIPEMLIHTDLEVKEELYKWIKQVWEEEHITLSWKTGLICPIHKKGDNSDYNNYRGIILLKTIYKIVTSLINMRIMKIAEDELGEYQCGFHKGNSKMDQIFGCIKH
jgi:hypothetical protein